MLPKHPFNQLKCRDNNWPSIKPPSFLKQNISPAGNQTFLSLANLAENSAPGTANHGTKVALYTHLLVRQLYLTKASPLITPDYIEEIVPASLLHDIGKIYLPDDMLCKAGPLSTEERFRLHEHVNAGSRMLLSAYRNYPDAHYLKLAAEIALYHHEKYDGSGYNSNIEGAAIPLSARIVALADVYDAFTSERPYKKIWSHNKAKAIIEEESGRHFDPVVVSAFLSCHQQFKAIASDFSRPANYRPNCCLY